MKRFPLTLAVALLVAGSMWAQDGSQDAVQPNVQSTAYTFTFTDVQYPNDTFTQLLGISNGGMIAGYHNFNSNSGFTLRLPKSFTTENYPNSAMTQVIGVNNSLKTAGFYVDQAGVTHGFTKQGTTYTTVDFPGSAFNQLLSQNDQHQAAGYYSMSTTNSTPDFPYVFDENGNVFEVITIPGAVGGAQATGINNSGQVCGFYIDSKGVNHGFYLNLGTLKTLNYPGSTFTQALGLNNVNEIVGTYTDKGGAGHGFIYNTSTSTWQSVDDPNGIGSTVVNGINDNHQIVGFWGTAPDNTGFEANPQ